MARGLAICLLLVVFLMIPAALMAQDATSTPETLLVGSVGLLAEEGNVLYSIFLANNTTDELSDLTIASALPEGATFVEMFWTPEDAVFAGEDNGTITWTLPEITADTIVGPFTYSVTFDDDAKVIIPANVAATAIWSEGEASAQLFETELSPHEDSGSITVDAAGTDGVVPVENTGVHLLVPPGAYDQPVTFTFERQPLTEDSDLPPVPEGESIWWCTQFNVSVEPAGIEASQPVYLLLPTRRTLTPGMEVINFIQPPQGEWATVESTEASQVSSHGNHITIPLLDVPLLANFTLIAGVDTKTRAASRSDGKGSGWTNPDPEP